MLHSITSLLKEDSTRSRLAHINRKFEQSVKRRCGKHWGVSQQSLYATYACNSETNENEFWDSTNQ